MNDINQAVPNILIVDDISANLTMLTEIIKSAGYVARPANSVKQALKALNTLTPSLIILDVSMPDTDGFEFCAMLKKNPATRDIPVIFISALSSPEFRIKGLKLGAVDYITKPFEIEEVILRIKNHLKMHKIQQELEIYNKKLTKIISGQINQIQEEQKIMLYALAKLNAAREGAGDSHIFNLGKNCRLLAMCMQLSPVFEQQISNDFIETIELAAPLHDIGKISIPDNLLKKRRGLTKDEWNRMKEHTILGAEILEDIYSFNEQNNFIRMSINIARYHHENWDGSGYPEGLSGTDIPLSARIVSVIDTYDVLISKRFYKDAYSHEESMDIINSLSGKKFDPDIIEMLNRIQHKL